MGDHSVVYGYPALAVPTQNLKTIAIISILKDSQHHIIHGKHTQIIRTFIDKVTQTLGISDKLSVKIQSNIPIQRGLGSSAALFNSIILALSNLYKLKINSAKHFELVNLGEKITHGQPSGLDTFTVINDLPTYFDQKIGNQILPIHIRQNLLVIDSGICGETKTAINLIKTEISHHQLETAKRLAQLGKNTAKFISQIQRGHSGLLGKLMSENHDILNQLQVTTPLINDIVFTCLSAGAIGAKMTGGGLGGTVIALTKPGHVNELKNILKSKFPKMTIWSEQLESEHS